MQCRYSFDFFSSIFAFLSYNLICVHWYVNYIVVNALLQIISTYSSKKNTVNKVKGKAEEKCLLFLFFLLYCGIESRVLKLMELLFSLDDCWKDFSFHTFSLFFSKKYHFNIREQKTIFFLFLCLNENPCRCST